MIKELQESLDNQIKELKFQYSLESDIVKITSDYFKEQYSFDHPVASVAWTWKHFDIWLINRFLQDDSDTIFSIIVFDNNNEESDVYAMLDIYRSNPRDLDVRQSPDIATTNEMSDYFKTITEWVSRFNED